jgi:hypothetical protein
MFAPGFFHASRERRLAVKMPLRGLVLVAVMLWLTLPCMGGVVLEMNGTLTQGMYNGTSFSGGAFNGNATFNDLAPFTQEPGFGLASPIGLVTGLTIYGGGFGVAGLGDDIYAPGVVILQDSAQSDLVAGSRHYLLTLIKSYDYGANSGGPGIERRITLDTQINLYTQALVDSDVISSAFAYNVRQGFQSGTLHMDLEDAYYNMATGSEIQPLDTLNLDGQIVTVTVITPEPPTLALAVMGSFTGLGMWWRRRATA